MNRLKGLVVFLGGLVLVMLGLGMWRSPEIDWEGFLMAWALVINDIIRLSHDPFAALGVVVLAIGFWIAVNGIRRMVLQS